MKKNKGIFFIAALFSSVFSLAQTAPVDWLKVPGPVTFNREVYKLSWTSHPSANYYKQEYIQKGDNAERFSSMLMIEVLTGTDDLKNTVAAKIAELTERKKSDPIVNFESFENKTTGEYMLDFLLSQNGADGKTDIAEHNIYRYKSFINNKGEKCILLFGIVSRSYGSYIDPFLLKLKKDRPALIKAVSTFKFPVISIH